MYVYLCMNVCVCVCACMIMVEFSYSQQDCKFLMLFILVAIWRFVARHECLGFHDGKKERKKERKKLPFMFESAPKRVLNSKQTIAQTRLRSNGINLTTFLC